MKNLTFDLSRTELRHDGARFWLRSRAYGIWLPFMRRIEPNERVLVCVPARDVFRSIMLFVLVVGIMLGALSLEQAVAGSTVLMPEHETSCLRGLTVVDGAVLRCVLT